MLIKMTLKNAAAEGLSIIVLTCNRRELLRGCMESLFAQEDPGIPLEFIVVDDGSSDGTGDMVRRLTASRPQWNYVCQEHKGIATARNAGIRNSRFTWIAIVADDYLLPAGYARSIRDFFRDHPEAQIVRFKIVASAGTFFCRVLNAYHEASVIRRLTLRNSTWNRRGMWQRSVAEEKITTDHDLEAAGAAVFRAGIFQQIGGFDESFSRGEDSDFTRRLRAAGIPVHYSPFLHIRHRYDPHLGTALKNVFAAGRASWRISAAPEQKPAGVAYILRLGLRSCLAAIYWSCWRTWQTAGPARFFLYFPVLLLLETSNRSGFFSECVRSRKQTPTACGQRLNP
jgi:GT2 family glycosyltransferase